MPLPVWLRRNGSAAALPPRDAYAQWAPSYPPRPHNLLMAVEQAAVEALLPALRGVAALDAGCGTGRYLRLLASRGARTVVGVDFSPEMLSQGRVDGLPRVLGDLRALPLADGVVEVVVCGLALNDVDPLEVPLAELARVLAPDGVLVYSVLHPRGASLGWTRTFDSPAGPRTVAGHWHTRHDHERACRSTRLEIERIDEPVPADGSSDGGPVALVVRARRQA